MAAAPTEHGSHEMLERDAMMDEDIERFLTDEDSSSGVDSAFAEEQEQLLNDAAEDIDTRDYEDAEATDSEDDDEALHESRHSYSSVPIVMPRSRYAGICNVETIKDGERRSCLLKSVLTKSCSKLPGAAGRIRCLRV